MECFTSLQQEVFFFFPTISRFGHMHMDQHWKLVIIIIVIIVVIVMIIMI